MMALIPRQPEPDLVSEHIFGKLSSMGIRGDNKKDPYAVRAEIKKIG